MRFRPMSNFLMACLCWLIATTATLDAEPRFESVPRFDRLSVEHGLSHTTVWAALQDAGGYMWFGTEEGLNRFDGYDFKTYKHDNLDPTTLSANGVMAMLQDRRGRMWMGTYGGGLSLFEPRTETFRHFRHQVGNSASLSHDIVFTLLEDADDNLWIGTRAGLHRMAAEGFEVQRIPMPLPHKKDGEPRILALFQDHSGTLWAGTDCGIVTFDITGPTSSCVRTPAAAEGSAEATVYTLAEDAAGRLWVGTIEGLRYLDEISSQLLTSPLGRPWIESPVQSLFTDREGILWVGYSTEGLTRFDPSSGEKATFHTDPSDPRSLSDESVISITQDRTGILWITTFLGVSRLDPMQRQFPTYRHQLGHPNSLNSNSIWAIHEDQQGDLWVGTYNEGLNRIDRQAGRVTHYVPDPEDPDSLLSGAINALHETDDGTLWVGTWVGLSRWDARRESFATLRHRPDDVSSLSHDIVQVLHEDNRQRLWVGTFQGLDLLDRGTQTFRRFDYDGGIPASTSIGSIVEDSAGGLWFGSGASGLFYLPSDTTGQPTFGRFMHREGDVDSLATNKIASLYLDDDGILWIGSYGSGLDRYDPASGGFTHYRERDGLPNNTVLGILQDDDGFLWLSTFSGLGRFDPVSGRCQTFTRSHGLQGNTFSDGSYFRNRAGELLFGGTAGLNIIDPKAVVQLAEPPIVRLTDFRLLTGNTELAQNTVKTHVAEDDMERPTTSSPATPSPATSLQQQFLDGNVVLQHHQDLFAIDFAALHYANPSGHRYSYHLEGFDDTWVHTDARKRFAQYSNLDAGTYLFQVRAETAEGVASQAPASLQIVVLPPPWKTWWAYSAYSIVLLGALAAFLALNRRKIDRERSINRQLRDVDRLKSEFLANTSHELRTPLYGMTGIAESLIDGAAGALTSGMRANLSMIVASGRRLTSLVDDLLDFSKLGQGHLSLQKKPIDLASICEVVLTLSRPLIGGKNLSLHNRVPVALPPALGDENRLLQILHNLVGNAIKFTQDGQVTVGAEVVENTLVVRVSDSGIGVAEDQWERIFEPFVQIDAAVERRHGGAGLGLSVARELVRVHGGRIWVENNTPHGMVFLFSLPIATATDQEAHIETLSSELGDSSIVETPRNSAVQPVVEARPDDNLLSKDRDFHILIVDDESINRQILVNMLSVQGYRLTETASGAEALRKLSEESFDLVLLDIMMPHMSGYEVCRTLRQSHSMQALPVIFLTAKAQDSDLVSGFAAGGNDYLIKPVRRLELIARVRSHLELVYMHRHVESLVESRTRRISELNEELEARNSELEKFTYAVSHDLKSPLVTIKGFLGFARQDALCGNEERINKDFDRIVLATDKMHRQLDSILELSRTGYLRHGKVDDPSLQLDPPSEE